MPPPPPWIPFSLENDGTENLSAPWPWDNSQDFYVNAMDLAYIDIDREGCLDIFMGLCDGTEYS